MSRPPAEDFLSRWSRRKRADVDEEETLSPAEVAPQEVVEPPSDETEEELLARLDLPDPDTMEPGDDFSRFMASAVPEHLRRRALRKLWRSNPTFAVLDGLNEYDEDYTKGFVPAGTLKTAYQVGRGFVSKLSEAAEPDPDDTPVATNAPDKNDQEIAEASETVPEEPPEEVEPAQDRLEDTETVARATRRRMQFRVAPND